MKMNVNPIQGYCCQMAELWHVGTMIVWGIYSSLPNRNSGNYRSSPSATYSLQLVFDVAYRVLHHLHSITFQPFRLHILHVKVVSVHLQLWYNVNCHFK